VGNHALNLLQGVTIMFKLIGALTNGLASIITEFIGATLPVARAARIKSEGIEKSVILDDECDELERMKKRASNKAAYAEYMKQLEAEPTIQSADLKKAA